MSPVTNYDNGFEETTAYTPALYIANNVRRVGVTSLCKELISFPMGDTMDRLSDTITVRSLGRPKKICRELLAGVCSGSCSMNPAEKSAL
jgi:hypothetical protein